MKTLAQLQADRAAAGAAYAAAAAAYVSAYVELHAHDQALSNGNVGGAGSVQGQFPSLNAPTPHGEFLREPLHGDANDRARARCVEIIASLEA